MDIYRIHTVESSGTSKQFQLKSQSGIVLILEGEKFWSYSRLFPCFLYAKLRQAGRSFIFTVRKRRGFHYMFNSRNKFVTLLFSPAAYEGLKVWWNSVKVCFLTNNGCTPCNVLIMFTVRLCESICAPVGRGHGWICETTGPPDRSKTKKRQQSFVSLWVCLIL